MIAIDIEGEFIPNLLMQLKTIPGVVQVRCNKPLRKKYRDLVGDDGVYILCLVQKKDGSDFFIKFEDYYTHAEANDPSKHEAIIASVQTEVEDYLNNDIMPTNMYQLNEMADDPYGKNFKTLIDRMKLIPNVVQVRYHNPLKQQYVDMIGSDGFIISAYVANKDQDDFYLPFITMAPKAVCFNLDKHDSLVQHLQQRVADYIENDVTPPNSVSVDEMQILQV
jgi:hypothetical protein